MEVPTNRSRAVLQVAVFSLICSFSFVFARDIVHPDDIAPKRPGCDNNFVLVKVPTWIIGDGEEEEFFGVGAQFGPTLESKEKDADKSRVALADPPDCCKHNIRRSYCLLLTGEVIMVHRGNCSFTAMAHVAEAEVASAILIVSNQTSTSFYKHFSHFFNVCIHEFLLFWHKILVVVL
ncbi:putative peptidase A22B, signal peptide peptidase [Helianthus debilis subsp. tardiflorus]